MICENFYCLADFVNPGIFGTYQDFRSYYELPLQECQNPEASSDVKDLANERTRELMKIADTFVLRRLQSVNGHTYLQLYAQRKDTVLQDLTPLQIITVLKKYATIPHWLRVRKPLIY
ncbi:unnamed protein product [Ceratitis capitata]|uniref:(Mediterranean fruit fly) hypothetical protein n=1 Tax=Ceratitis capitata TaxID=7213 RepID=A0A811UWY3_CERCA|nr:unnamed protein product [Ceratitis capitata]